MSAAEKLAERNDIIIALADTDQKLAEALSGQHTYRKVGECRELLGIRQDQADALIALGGEPGPTPGTETLKVVA